MSKRPLWVLNPFGDDSEHAGGLHKEHSLLNIEVLVLGSVFWYFPADEVGRVLLDFGLVLGGFAVLAKVTSPTALSLFLEEVDVLKDPSHDGLEGIELLVGRLYPVVDDLHLHDVR